MKCPLWMTCDRCRPPALRRGLGSSKSVSESESGLGTTRGTCKFMARSASVPAMVIIVANFSALWGAAWLAEPYYHGHAPALLIGPRDGRGLGWQVGLKFAKPVSQV